MSYACPHCINGLNDRTLGVDDLLRVLVSGWRFWPRRHAYVVWNELDKLKERLGISPIVIVDGMCPRGGVDDYANEWARNQHQEKGPVLTERHPAIYTSGRLHGPERNSHMVELGIDYFLSFPQSWSKRTGGTWDCTRKAWTAGCSWHVQPYEP